MYESACLQSWVRLFESLSFFLSNWSPRLHSCKLFIQTRSIPAHDRISLIGSVNQGYAFQRQPCQRPEIGISAELYCFGGAKDTRISRILDQSTKETVKFPSLGFFFTENGLFEHAKLDFD